MDFALNLSYMSNNAGNNDLITYDLLVEVAPKSRDFPPAMSGA